MSDDDPFHSDPVLARLGSLPHAAPPSELGARIRAAAVARLVPRRLHVGWALAVAALSFVYLAGAFEFVVGLF